jgi:Helix-turn-helix of DDE superfamily endonuclease
VKHPTETSTPSPPPVFKSALVPPETRQLRQRAKRGNPSVPTDMMTDSDKVDSKELEAKENHARHNRIKAKRRRIASDSDSSDDENHPANPELLDNDYDAPPRYDSPVNFDDDLSNLGEYIAYAKMNDPDIHYLIGFERYKFEFLYTCIMNTKLKFPFGAIPILDQMFITLYRYKHNTDFKLIALIFGLPNELAASDIVGKWTVLLVAFLNMVGFRCVDISQLDLHAVIRDTTDILLKKSQNFSNTPRMSI